MPRLRTRWRGRGDAARTVASPHGCSHGGRRLRFIIQSSTHDAAKLDERIEALEERGITPEITAAIKKLEAERDEISQRWGGADKSETNGAIDFLTLPVFQQWRLDGMLRSK